MSAILSAVACCYGCHDLTEQTLDDLTKQTGLLILHHCFNFADIDVKLMLNNRTETHTRGREDSKKRDYVCMTENSTAFRLLRAIWLRAHHWSTVQMHFNGVKWQFWIRCTYTLFAKIIKKKRYGFIRGLCGCVYYLASALISKSVCVPVTARVCVQRGKSNICKSYFESVLITRVH